LLLLIRETKKELMMKLEKQIEDSSTTKNAESLARSQSQNATENQVKRELSRKILELEDKVRELSSQK
jgi:hypothetical protein